MVDWNALTERLTARAHPAAVIGFGVVTLAVLYALPRWIDQRYTEERQFGWELSRVLDQTAAAREHIGSLDLLKNTDLDQIKAGLSGHALSQKTLMESGLSLQEERRLLEKQLEIMTTTLFVNPSLQRIFLLRADQPLQSYL